MVRWQFKPSKRKAVFLLYSTVKLGNSSCCQAFRKKIIDKFNHWGKLCYWIDTTISSSGRPFRNILGCSIVCLPCPYTIPLLLNLRLVDFKDGWPSTTVIFFNAKPGSFQVSQQIPPKSWVSICRAASAEPAACDYSKGTQCSEILDRDGFALAFPGLPQKLPQLKPQRWSGRSCVGWTAICPHPIFCLQISSHTHRMLGLRHGKRVVGGIKAIYYTVASAGSGTAGPRASKEPTTLSNFLTFVPCLAHRLLNGIGDLYRRLMFF